MKGILIRSLICLDLGGHAIAAAGFGAVGYYFHGLADRQEYLIAQKKAEILQNREKREQRLAAKASEKED